VGIAPPSSGFFVEDIDAGLSYGSVASRGDESGDRLFLKGGGEEEI